MKVGDYVRTKNGEIGKLVNVEVYYVLGQDDKDKYSCVLFNNSYIPAIVSNDFISKRGLLIDLIEVGDYVNGERVDYIDDCKGAMREFYYTFEEVTHDVGHYEEEIKSIVTKECFESMKYEVN